MRTGQLVDTLRANLENLSLQQEQVNSINPSNGQPQILTRVSGVIKLKNSISILEEAGLLTNQIQQLKKTALYNNKVSYETNADQLTVNQIEGNKIIENIEYLRIIANQLYNALSEVIKPEPDNSINIKLPDSIKDFGDLEKFAHDINLGLNQAIYDDGVDGKVEIIGVENGSIWLQVLLGTPSAVILIGSIVWAAMVIRKKKLEGDFVIQQIRGLGIRNDGVEEIQQAQKELLNQLTEAEASHISDESTVASSPERIERLKFSIETFSNLINQGTEIYPSLNAPESVNNLFPDPRNILGISSHIKQIGKE